MSLTSFCSILGINKKVKLFKNASFFPFHCPATLKSQTFMFKIKDTGLVVALSIMCKTVHVTELQQHVALFGIENSYRMVACTTPPRHLKTTGMFNLKGFSFLLII